MKLLVSLCASILIGTVLLNFLPVHGEEKIYDNTVRLHVIAASDREEDQALKLKVRDSILALVSEKLCGVDDTAVACSIISGMTDDIEQCAEETLSSEGSDAVVCVTFDLEEYPIRYYEDFTLPAGVYKSLKVTIDNGEGKNWWCILFPSVCVKDAEKAEDEYIQAGFTPDQYKMIENGNGRKYKVRFKVLEILSDLFGFGY